MLRTGVIADLILKDTTLNDAAVITNLCLIILQGKNVAR